MWLDSLGKWSLIDAYVLVLMMVAFSFNIETPVDLDYLPPGFLDLHIYVVKLNTFILIFFFFLSQIPGWGIYGFIPAVVISLIVYHFF